MLVYPCLPWDVCRYLYIDIYKYVYIHCLCVQDTYYLLKDYDSPHSSVWGKGGSMDLGSAFARGGGSRKSVAWMQCTLIIKNGYVYENDGWWWGLGNLLMMHNCHLYIRGELFSYMNMLLIAGQWKIGMVLVINGYLTKRVVTDSSHHASHCDWMMIDWYLKFDQ